jgi:Spy/CpxP family protein refolding chaperone
MNIRNLMISASILCLSVALTVAAGAQGTTATPSSPDTHAQSAPGTQPPTSPGPSSNSQSSTGSQSAAPSQGTAGSSSANSGQSGSNSVEDELNLTQDQKQKIAEVVDDENKQISTVRNDTSMSMEQKQQKVMQIRQEGAPRIKAILTPDQLQKLAAIQQRMRDQQQGGAGANAPQSSPQGGTPQSTSPQSTTPQSTTPQQGTSPQR